MNRIQFDHTALDGKLASLYQAALKAAQAYVVEVDQETGECSSPVIELNFKMSVEELWRACADAGVDVPADSDDLAQYIVLHAENDIEDIAVAAEDLPVPAAPEVSLEEFGTVMRTKLPLAVRLTRSVEDAEIILRDNGLAFERVSVDRDEMLKAAERVSSGNAHSVLLVPSDLLNARSMTALQYFLDTTNRERFPVVVAGLKRLHPMLSNRVIFLNVS